MLEFKVMVPGAVAVDTIEVTSPFDCSVVGKVERIDDRGAELALNTADKLFKD